jgi:hypothetical protein
MYIGTTAHAINRGSGAEALTGITGLTPGANFILTQNSVAALTSEETGAVANTMYLKAGNIGIGTNNPTYKVDVRGSGVLGQINAAAGLCIAGVCKTAWTDSGIGSSSWVTTGNDIYYTLGNVGIGTTSPQAGLHVATSNILFGSGNGTATPSDVYIKGPAASGTNISGSNMFLDTPAGTGTGNSGSLIFRTSPGLSWQPIALDNSSVGSAYGYNGSGVLVTISHAVDAGKSNKILIVATSVRIPIEYVRYDGVDMHLLDSKGSAALVQLWYLKDSELHTGTHNVTIHSASTNGQMSAVAETFYNVDQTNSFGITSGVADNWGSSISTNVSAATNDMVIDVVGGAEDIGTPTVGSGQTLINYVGANNDNGVATSYKAGASTVNMSWTNVGGGYIKSQLGVALQSTKSSAPNAMAEAMRINISGNLGIGTTTPTQKLAVYNGSTTGTYTTSGWAHSSDARLKTNIMDVTNPLDKIKALSGVYFNWNTNPSADRQIGLIAQDTLKVLPEVVVGNERDGYGIAYGNLSALLIEGVKAQQTQLSNLSILTNSLQNSSTLQDQAIQKLQSALTILTTNTQDQSQITNQKINQIQSNLATTGSQINLLSTKLNSASNLLAQNTQPTQELPFYQFKTQSSELSSPLADQTIENNQFNATYNSPNNFQELNLQLHSENQLDLTNYDQNQTSLVYDVYIEDNTLLEDFHTELGNVMDQKELQWDRLNHPNFSIGWNEIRLPITDGTLTGTIDWQHLNYFRAYFKFNTNTTLKFKNIRIETKAKYQPLAQTLNTQNLDLWNNADQGTAIKSIFGELDSMKTQELASLQVDTKLTNDLKALQDQVTLLQDQTRAIIDFSLTLNLNNVIYRDTLGNIDLTGGKITAKDIEALSTIKAKDIEATNSLKGQNIELGAQVSGTNIIKAGQLESIKILTSQANAGIKLYITPKGSTQGKALYYDEGDIEPGIGFGVRIDAPALDKDIEFNWLIVK